MTAVLEEHPDTHRFYFVDPNFFGPVGRGRSRALNLAQLIRERFLLRPTPAYRAALAAGRLVVSAHNPYEGTVPYLHPEVAFLAETIPRPPTVSPVSTARLSGCSSTSSMVSTVGACGHRRNWRRMWWARRGPGWPRPCESGAACRLLPSA